MTEDRRRIADRLSAGLVLLLGAGHAAAAALQGSMNEDGIGYLDVGAAWLRGDWSNAISATWNPLYGLLLSPAALDAIPIGARLPLVHGLNFMIFVGAFVAFRGLWRELGLASGAHAGAQPGTAPVPPVPWLLAGHALFAWATLNLIEMWTVTPDLLMAGLVFGAATLLLRHRARPVGRTAFGFGILLGLAYLAKPVMFPLGLLFLGVAALAWAPGRLRRAWLGSAGAATAGFLLFALPWVVAVSVKQGEPTFGASGTVTYLRYVNDVSYPFLIDPGSSTGEPLHPIRRVAEEPDVWAFGDPVVGGTYPPGFDPAYWYAGVEPRLLPRRQLEELSANLAFTFELVARRLGLPLGALLVALWLSYGRPEPEAGRMRLAATAVGPLGVLGLGVVGIGLYLPVLAEGRYLAAFLVLGFGAALALVRVPNLRGGALTGRAVAMVVLLGLLLEIVAFNLSGVAQLAGVDVTPRANLGFGPAPGPAPPTSVAPVGAAPPMLLRSGSRDHPRVATALAAAGVGPGTPVGVIGWAFDSYWAWLADLRVVAEMPGEYERYWGATDERRAELDSAFAAAGVQVVVAEIRPDPLPAGWEPLGDTGLAVRRLVAGGGD